MSVNEVLELRAKVGRLEHEQQSIRDGCESKLSQLRKALNDAARSHASEMERMRMLEHEAVAEAARTSAGRR